MVGAPSGRAPAPCGSPPTLAVSHDPRLLVPLLREADEDADRIARAIAEPANVAYAAWRGGRAIGAVLMRWDEARSEILYMAVEPAERGKGCGKAIVAAVLVEARLRRVNSVVVGTANSSLDNIAFYQKCGFRMDSIRRNHFAYLPAPVHENGIRLVDMIVFRHDLPLATNA